MIINSVLVLVSPQGEGNPSYVVEDHERDDGLPPYRVEGFRPGDADHEKAMLERVPEIEAIIAKEAEQATERAAALAVDAKVEAYVLTLDPKLDIGLTDEEVAILEKKRAESGGDVAAVDGVAVVP